MQKKKQEGAIAKARGVYQVALTHSLSHTNTIFVKGDARGPGASPRTARLREKGKGEQRQEKKSKREESCVESFKIAEQEK